VSQITRSRFGSGIRGKTRRPRSRKIRSKLRDTGSVDVDPCPSTHSTYRVASSCTMSGWHIERSPRRKCPLKSTVLCSFGAHPGRYGPVGPRGSGSRRRGSAHDPPILPCEGSGSPCSSQEVGRRAAGAVPGTTAASAPRPSPSAAPPAASAPMAASRAPAGAGRGFGPKDPPRPSGHAARATCRPSCARSQASAIPPRPRSHPVRASPSDDVPTRRRFPSRAS
jgi:hypothetical protein